jgi:hypothetical protein
MDQSTLQSSEHIFEDISSFALGVKYVQSLIQTFLIIHPLLHLANRDAGLFPP